MGMFSKFTRRLAIRVATDKVTTKIIKKLKSHRNFCNENKLLREILVEFATNSGMDISELDDVDSWFTVFEFLVFYLLQFEIPHNYPKFEYEFIEVRIVIRETIEEKL